MGDDPLNVGGQTSHWPDTGGIPQQNSLTYYCQTTLEDSKWQVGVPPPWGGSGGGGVGYGGAVHYSVSEYGCALHYGVTNYGDLNGDGEEVSLLSSKTVMGIGGD